MFTACVPSLVEKTANKEVPANFHNSQDTLPDFVGTQKDTMSSAQIKMSLERFISLSLLSCFSWEQWTQKVGDVRAINNIH